MLITPPNHQAAAYGTYWKYLAEHYKIAWDVPSNVFSVLVAAAAVSQRLNYFSCRGSWGEHFPKSATAIHSVAVDRTGNLPIERQTSHLRSNEMFDANA